MATTVRDIAEFEKLVGTHLGYSEWVRIDQDRVNLFADATDDHQWIHVDPERAASGPFGGTIAHGYLTLSLIPGLMKQVLVVEGIGFGLNYGCNKVRFPSPLPVGADVRMGMAVAALEKTADNGVQISLDVTFEIRDAPKPACVAQVVYRYYP